MKRLTAGIAAFILGIVVSSCISAPINVPTKYEIHPTNLQLIWEETAKCESLSAPYRPVRIFVLPNGVRWDSRWFDNWSHPQPNLIGGYDRASDAIFLDYHFVDPLFMPLLKHELVHAMRRYAGGHPDRYYSESAFINCGVLP